MALQRTYSSAAWIAGALTVALVGCIERPATPVPPRTQSGISEVVVNEGINKVDLILMVDVYHEFDHPFEMTEKMVEALKPGGRLVFVEFRLEDEKVPIKLVHKMSERQVLKEMGVFPEMEHAKTIGTLPWQHVIVFTKKGMKK